MLIRVANTIPQDYGPSYEPFSKNEDEVTVPHNSNESRVCSHQVLVSSPLVEELAVEKIARTILLGSVADSERYESSEDPIEPCPGYPQQWTSYPTFLQ